MSVGSLTETPRKKLRRAFAGYALALACLTSTTLASEGAVERPELLTQPLVSSAGERTSLTDLMDGERWTLVMLWSVDCYVCKRETPSISDLHDEYQHSLVQVVGIALDGVDATGPVEAFRRTFDMRFPSLLGDLLPVAVAYEALTAEPLRGTPTYLLFDPTGRLRGLNVGPLRTRSVVDFIGRKS